MNWPLLWDLAWRLLVIAGNTYALYVIFVKVPRLERELKGARAAAVFYAQWSLKVRK